MFRRRRIAIAVLAVTVLVSVAIIAFRFAVTGLSSALNEPPKAEIAVATWLLRQSVPAAARALVNPLGRDPADIAAGQDVFRRKCEICHGYDGGGKTEIGAGVYPRPPALRAMDIQALTDGEMFYIIQKGEGDMTGEGDRQKPEEIWNMINYVRSLSKKTQATKAKPAR